MTHSPSDSSPLPSSSPHSSESPTSQPSGEAKHRGPKPSDKPPWWRRKRLWFTAVFILALYPTVVTLALWTGLVERALASEDLRVEIDNPSFSLIPGHVHLKKVRVYLNGTPQFVLFADDVEARIEIFPLFSRKFALSWLAAKNVVYRLRVPQEADQADAPRVRAFPQLEGLPGKNAVSKQEAQEGEEDEPLWTVELNGMDVKFNELWFFEYRYVGPGELHGGFERGPDVLYIDTSLEKLGPGSLRYGKDQIISNNFQGHVRARIPRMDPSEHADLNFFDFVRLNIDLKADVETLKHVGNYVSGVTVSEGGGPFRADIEMLGGRLAPSTVLSYQTDELNLKAMGFGLKTDWSVRVDMPQATTTQAAQKQNKSDGAPGSRDAEVAEGKAPPGTAPTAGTSPDKTSTDKNSTDKVEAEKVGEDKVDSPPAGPRIESRSKITYVSFAAVGKPPFTIQLHQHLIRAALASPQIDENLDVASASFELPRIVSTNLTNVGSFTSESLKTDGGEAEASLKLEMNENKDFVGPFEASLEGLDLDIDPIQISLNGRAESQVFVSLKNEVAALRDLGITLQDVRFVIGKNTIDDWWLKMNSERIGVNWDDPSALRADFLVSAKDAEPVLRVLAEGEKVPKVVASLIKLRNVETRAKLRKQGETLDLMLENVDTSFIDFSGRIYQSDDEKRLALLIGGKAVSLGVVQHGQQKRFRALAHADWLNDQLEDFPSPKDLVEGQQP